MERHSQRKTLFSNSFQNTNLIIEGCVRTTYLDIFFVGGRKIHCNALIEIPLLVTIIVAGEFCHQHMGFGPFPLFIYLFLSTHKKYFILFSKSEKYEIFFHLS